MAALAAAAPPGSAQPLPEPLPDQSSGPSPQAPPASFTAEDRARRLMEKGMASGSEVMIRIFKGESELELWLKRGDRFELFATYPICFWSGRLGPKLREGDRQAPEGFYTLGTEQLRYRGRLPRSFSLGFPNRFDRAHARTGSHILVHGACESTGCYAMTDQVMDEIFALSEQALREGQARIQVHVFPFRMIENNLRVFADHKWYGFWLDLKVAYDVFERTRVPPKIGICDRRYVASEGDPAAEALPAGAWDALMPCEKAEAEAAQFQIPQSVESVVKQTAKHTTRARRHVRRGAGRKGRKAHAGARRARTLAGARRMRTSHAGASERAH